MVWKTEILLMEEMKMHVSELLPIGSVVLLKDGEKKLMICGILQMNDNGRGKEYDYIGFLYPEGYMGVQFQYLFNHEDIDELIARGYENEERKEFIAKLEELYK
jgi:hypothetical protein